MSSPDVPSGTSSAGPLQLKLDQAQLALTTDERRIVLHEQIKAQRPAFFGDMAELEKNIAAHTAFLYIRENGINSSNSFAYADRVAARVGFPSGKLLRECVGRMQALEALGCTNNMAAELLELLKQLEPYTKIVNGVEQLCMAKADV